MSDLVLKLYTELFELAESQKKALQEERLEDAATLQRKRQEIIDVCEKYADGNEKISGQMLMIIEKILSVDSEIKTIVQKQMESISNKLITIQGVKQNLSTNFAHHKAGENLSICC